MHPLLKGIKTSNELLKYLVSKHVVPDLVTVLKVKAVLVGRKQIDFKKIIRILLTLVPDMILIVKQFLDNKTTFKQMKRYQTHELKLSNKLAFFIEKYQDKERLALAA